MKKDKENRKVSGKCDELLRTIHCMTKFKLKLGIFNFDLASLLSCSNICIPPLVTRSPGSQ
jgi:hypothetical protein